MYLYLQKSSMGRIFLALTPSHCSASTSAQSFPLVMFNRFFLKSRSDTGLNQDVPLQITLEILCSHGISIFSILIRASSTGPMKGCGQDQKPKCGISQSSPPSGPRDRAKDQAFLRGESFMEIVKVVSGRGTGDVMMARYNC